MGKSLPSLASLQSCTRIAADGIGRTKLAKPALNLKSLASSKQVIAANSSAGRRGFVRGMEQQADSVPLKDVVADCTRRWFQDALKEARAGDTAMQVLVGQMYHSGYGVPKNDQKANAWISKASKCRSSVWKVSNKRPGYNASDSDSDEEKNIMKS